MRFSASNSRAVLMLLLAGGMLPCCAAPPAGDRRARQLVAEIGEVLRAEAYADGVDFGRWEGIAAHHGRAFEAASGPVELVQAMNRALGELGVSHLTLFTPEQARSRFRGERWGLGATFQPDEGALLVVSVVEEGPAWAAGLRSGDRVTEVSGMAPAAGARLPGAPDQAVELCWVRGGATYSGVITPARHRRASPDRLRWLDGEIAWIRIHTFIDELYDRELVEGMFRAAVASSGIILDLRSNPGGDSRNTRHLLGRVFPADTPLMSSVQAADLPKYLAAKPTAPRDTRSIAHWLERPALPIPAGDGTPPFSGPVAVLVDGRTGSGGEVAAALIQERGRGVLVGSPTLGMVRIADQFPLHEGYVLLAPVGEYVTPGGRLVEGHPLQPSLRLTATDTATDTVIVDAARRLLLGRGGSPKLDSMPR